MRRTFPSKQPNKVVSSLERGIAKIGPSHIELIKEQDKESQLKIQDIEKKLSSKPKIFKQKSSISFREGLNPSQNYEREDQLKSSKSGRQQFQTVSFRETSNSSWQNTRKKRTSIFQPIVLHPNSLTNNGAKKQTLKLTNNEMASKDIQFSNDSVIDERKGWKLMRDSQRLQTDLSLLLLQSEKRQESSQREIKLLKLEIQRIKRCLCIKNESEAIYSRISRQLTERSFRACHSPDKWNSRQERSLQQSSKIKERSPMLQSKQTLNNFEDQFIIENTQSNIQAGEAKYAEALSPFTVAQTMNPPQIQEMAIGQFMERSSSNQNGNRCYNVSSYRLVNDKMRY